MERLTIQSPALDAPRAVPLDRARAYTIGRKDCDIVIEFEAHASRTHGRLEFRGNCWRLIDLGSANGTKFNGKPANFVDLLNGSTAMIGGTTIGVEFAPSHAAPEKAPPHKRSNAPHSGRAHPVPRHRVPATQVKSNATLVVIVACVALAAGGVIFWALVTNNAPGQSVGTASQPARSEARTPDQTPLSPALKKLSDELDAIEAAEPPEERAVKLAQFQRENKRDVSGTVLAARLTDLISLTDNQIDSGIVEWRSNVTREVNLHREKCEYAKALADVQAALKSVETRNSYWRGRTGARDFEAELRNLRDSVLPEENAQYFDVLVMRADNAATLGNHEEGKALLMTARAQLIMDAFTDAALETKLLKLEEAIARGSKTSPVLERPSVEGDANDILSKLKPPTKLRLPGHNPLLPNGPESEAAAIRTLYETLAGAKEKLRSASLKFATFHAVVQDVTADGVKAVITGGSTREIPWREFLPEQLSTLLTSAGKRGKDSLLGLSLLAFERGNVQLACTWLVEMYEFDHSAKEGIDILIASKRKMAIPEGGFVVHEGRFMAPMERDKAQLDAQIQAFIKQLLDGVNDRKDETLRAADEAFDELFLLGDVAVEPTIKALDAKRVEIRAIAEKATGLFGDTSELKSLKEELNRRRADAIKLIYDEQRWPYPYGPNNQAVTKEVIDLIEKVEEVWNNPVNLQGKKNPDFERNLKILVWINARMDQLDSEKTFHQSTSAADIDYLGALANKQLDVRTFALNDAEKQMMVYNAAVMEENAERWKKHKGVKGAPADEQWEQLRITNEYRIMMGRRALKMNFKLSWACWHHSKYIVEHNNSTIAHYIKGEPRGEGPGDRARYEGYNHPAGENIHWNSGTPTAESSHFAWIASSGHSRNVLNDIWVVMGNGRYGTVWTQLFGNVDEGEGNDISRGGE